ncbi:TIM-barrel domain-containing protein [Lactobacillus juensis]|uniref:TIM-barrel domain-containing protein n=1 Tax=Lactobacillus juensis TaxID=3082862 RepID=UPI0030C7789D
MIQNTQTNQHQLGALTGASKCDHYYELHFATGEIARFYVLAAGIFRLLIDPEQNFTENRTETIQLTQFDNSAFAKSQVRATNDSLIIHTGNYQIIFGQNPAVISIFDESLHHNRMQQSQPLELSSTRTREFLTENKNEFFYGGGLQNGYFSHRGHKIAIKHDQITGKGGVIMPVPFFWSNAGYGELRNTTATGTYDFGKTKRGVTVLTHQDAVFDAFYLLGTNPQEILQHYYTLTGKPMLLPKYAFGLGHIGNFCTTLWQPSQAKERNASKIGNNYYTRTKDEKAASGKASLNGEENYQFSARALIDRYHAMHFPLSWFVPNYGVQANNQQALSFFNEYALNQDVHPGFWHQSEVELPEKTAFTFTTNEIATKDKAQLQSYSQTKRSLVLADSGSTGMQKNAALIFGDVGGNWGNVATQVAGMLGANLSGQPLVGAAVDGLEGGGNAQINVRDFEWKCFTPLLFNFDDQGNFSKNPFAYNRKITDINLAYLKLRQHLTNYLYTLNEQAKNGALIMRPLFSDFPDELANYTAQFGNEFMLGSDLLIAPITNGREDENGDSRKDNLYLPGKKTMWIDLFTGKKYAGGKVYNNLSFPLWHLPVFVRGGSIFDWGNRDFLLYPQDQSETVIYNDNSQAAESNSSTTKIFSKTENETLLVTIPPVEGNWENQDVEQPTKLTILCDSYPDRITIKINDQVVPVEEYGSLDAFNHAREGIFYNTNYGLDEFKQYHKNTQTALQIKLASRDITTTKIEITVHNFNYGKKVLVHEITSGVLPSPKLPAVDSSKISAHSFELAWPHESAVQIEVNNLLYVGITGKNFTLHELTPNTRYIIRMRYVIGNKVSEWSDLFGVITKHAAKDYAIENIDVTCNYTSKENHPLSYLTDLKLASEWQTDQSISPEQPLELTFTFEKVEKLSRMVYVPRNIDHNGDPLAISIAVSTDGEQYTTYADHLQWKADTKNKVVGLRDVRAKKVHLTIYQSSGPIIAAREIIFFRAKR